MNERIVFMGTPSFSVSVLEMLLKEGYNVVGVVTQPDRKVGRKKVLTMSGVKELALKHDLPVFQPVKIRNEYQDIIDLDPDLIITAAYGQIIPDVILNTPRLGCVNVHASLLPKYRGGAPVHKAIIDGEEKTGVTIMYMEKRMDAGDIISQRETTIFEEDTVSILYDRLSEIGASLLKDTLPSIILGTNERIPQDESQVTYAYNIKREDEIIDWHLTSLQVFNKVRGTNSWPGSYSVYEGKNIKIWKGKYEEESKYDDLPGTIVEITKDSIKVQTGKGIYAIKELQIPGKKKIEVKNYLNGNSIFKVGGIFTNG